MCKITEKHLQCSEYEPHAAATFRTALTENLRVSMVILQPFQFSQHMTDLCVYNLSTALLSQCPAIHILELFTFETIRVELFASHVPTAEASWRPR